MRYLLSLLALVFSLIGGSALANDKTTQSFAPDPNVQKVAEAYALDAVEYSKTQFAYYPRLDRCKYCECRKGIGSHAFFVHKLNP